MSCIPNFLALQESFDLLQALLVLCHIEVLLDDRNEHVQHDDYRYRSVPTPWGIRRDSQCAKMNQRTRNAAPIQAVPWSLRFSVTLYRIAVQFSLERTWYIPRKEL